MHFLASSPRWRPSHEEDKLARTSILDPEPICRRDEQRITRPHRAFGEAQLEGTFSTLNQKSSLGGLSVAQVPGS